MITLSRITMFYVSLGGWGGVSASSIGSNWLAQIRQSTRPSVAGVQRSLHPRPPVRLVQASKCSKLIWSLLYTYCTLDKTVM